MVSLNQFREIALALPEVVEMPHFEKTSFRVNKKIFATLSEKDHIACVTLTEIDQDVFSAFDRSVIYPVPNKWGKHGWTFIVLLKVKKELLINALITAYCKIAPQRLSAIVRRADMDDVI
ncbi:MmcQ/YjbR family DNA-binding protein [Olivibacter domesticus]|uniref:YjbR protein n=1 Tax=Olivibacter domesticus TaxID=407022 RepID=A0A1H7MNX8_OLID1|nr:MmcQ/YjbR family DNA-binding protein [Olivibacter domesticus]SEL12317.1 YjbR protein [Olivibacter domesticus]